MPISIMSIPVLQDNYVWVLHDTTGKRTAVVDPGDAAPVRQFLDAAGWSLDLILVTHHHHDHVNGVADLHSHYGAQVVAPAAEASQIGRIDIPVHDGDRVSFGGEEILTIATPGHTAGEVSYYLPHPAALFCGDTLFSLGCGRLFEGSPKDMFHSLARFRELPDETLVCCGHEYTESNARFALTVAPENHSLRLRAEEVRKLRQQGKPTVPSTLGSERLCNPFVRADSAEQLGQLRALKDRF